MKIIFLLLLFVGCVSRDGKSDVPNSETKQGLPGMKVSRDIPYGRHPLQTLDIYFPPAEEKNNITIIYVHGGSWYAGDKDESINWARYFQRAGFNFIAINYRLTHTEENILVHNQMNDIDNAIYYVSGRSGDWNIDKDKFVIMGASAGGHLALLYAYKFNAAKMIKQAIALCGVLDLTDTALIKADFGDVAGGTVISWLIGDTATRAREKWLDASPLHYISPASVPTFFIHGKKDELIPFKQAETGFRQLKKHEVPSDLVLMDNVDHDLLSIELVDPLNKAQEFIRLNFKH